MIYLLIFIITFIFYNQGFNLKKYIVFTVLGIKRYTILMSGVIKCLKTFNFSIFFVKRYNNIKIFFFSINTTVICLIIHAVYKNKL